MKCVVIWSCWVVGVAMGSPILDYRANESVPTRFRVISLRHATVASMTPMLQRLCGDCQWVLDKRSQRVGLVSTKKRWAMYRRAIQAMDQPQPIMMLTIDLIEVTDTTNALYQNLFYQLTQPMVLGQSMQQSIEYLIESGDARVISSPRIMGRSGETATISVGDSIPYITSVRESNYIGSNVQYVDTGIRCTITPYLHRNRMVDLVVDLSYKTVTGYRMASHGQLPVLASRSSTLTLQVTANATVVFAGLLDQSEHQGVEKVPLLGDLPWIGGLFQKTMVKQRATDLIYKITPQLLGGDS